MLSGVPMLKPELEWMLVGERMNNGFVIYKDIWTSVSPLSGLVFWIVERFSSRSQFVYQVLSLVLSFFLIFYFNQVMINRNSFLEKNYVPGLVLLVFLHLSYDLLNLSPALLSVIFLLLAFNKIVKEMEKNSGVSDEIFEVGFFVGVATLFNQPSVVMIIWAFFSVVFFTTGTFRQYFLLLFGFILPICICILYFYLNDSFDQFSYNWLSSFVNVKSITFYDVLGVLIILIVPSLLALFGFFRVSVMLRYNSFQTRIQQIMLFWIIIALFSFIFMPNIYPSQGLIFCPPLAFFSTHLLLNFKSRFKADLIFTATSALIILMFFIGIKNWQVQNDILSLTDLKVKTTKSSELFAKQAVLIVGDDLSDYKNAIPATCYLNWDLSEIDLNNPDNYVSIINIFDNFKNDPPAFIVDQKNVIPRIFQRIPELSKKYKLIGKGIYKKV
jgi:hypothetical protein